MFVFGILFGLAMLAPLWVAFIDMFWYLVAGKILFHTWTAERIMLLVLWQVACFLVFVAATTHRK